MFFSPLSIFLAFCKLCTYRCPNCWVSHLFLIWKNRFSFGICLLACLRTPNLNPYIFSSSKFVFSRTPEGLHILCIWSWLYIYIYYTSLTQSPSTKHWLSYNIYQIHRTYIILQHLSGLQSSCNVITQELFHIMYIIYRWPTSTYLLPNFCKAIRAGVLPQELLHRCCYARHCYTGAVTQE